MRFGFAVEIARFVERPNRFLVRAELADGRIVRVHCADPGRLRELLLPGVRLYVSQARGASKRTTKYDLRFVEHPQTGRLVSLDSRLPNQLVAEALTQNQLAPFNGNVGWRSETPGPFPVESDVHSRFDFLIDGADGRRCWVEVKSVTLVEDGVARFPDAPTLRGQRHVEELTRIVEETTDRGAVLLIVQRPDADVVKPHWQQDPAFAHALARAAQAGVQLLAYTCELTLTSARLDRAIPVDVSRPDDAASPAYPTSR